jgi:plastocyanin
MNTKVIAIVAVLLLILGGGAFVLMQNNATTQDQSQNDMISESTITPMVTESMMESTDSGSMTRGEVKEFTVTGTNFKFDTTEMTVNKGDTVRITFVSESGMHDFVLDEFDAKTAVLESGGTETIEFVADEAGEFEYYCSVGSHRQMGMVGTLTVQ